MADCCVVPMEDRNVQDANEQHRPHTESDQIWIFMVKVYPDHVDHDNNDNHDDDGADDDDLDRPPTHNGKRKTVPSSIPLTKRPRSNVNAEREEDAIAPSESSSSTAVPLPPQPVLPAKKRNRRRRTLTKPQQPRTDIYYSRDPINAVRRFNGLDVLSNVDLNLLNAHQRELANASRVLSHAVASAAAPAITTVASATTRGVVGNGESLVVDNVSSPSSVAVALPPPPSPQKPPRVTRHMTRLDEALSAHNSDGLASVGALADAWFEQINDAVGGALPTTLSETAFSHPHNNNNNNNNNHHQSALERLLPVKASALTSATTASHTNGVSSSKRPLKIAALLPRMEDVLYAAYTHKGTIRRMSRSSSSSSTSSTKATAPSAKTAKQKKALMRAKPRSHYPRNTQPQHQQRHHLCMVIGPVTSDRAARAVTLLWMKPSRGIMPRAVWGETIAKWFDLEIYGDYEAIVGQLGMWPNGHVSRHPFSVDLCSALTTVEQEPDGDAQDDDCIE